MFDIVNVLKFLSLLTYIGFIVGGSSGLYEVSKNFNLCEMLVSVIVIISCLFVIYLQLSNELYRYLKNNKNVFYTSSLFMFICSLLILGLSDIGVGFGIWGIIMSITNGVLSIFITDEQANIET
jgi:hypothetical protein